MGVECSMHLKDEKLIKIVVIRPERKRHILKFRVILQDNVNMDLNQ